MFASIKAEYPKNSYTIYLSDNLTDNLEQYLSNFKKESVVFVCDNYFENKSFLPDDKLYKLIKNYKWWSWFKKFIGTNKNMVFF